MDCARCGIIFAKMHRSPRPAAVSPPPSHQSTGAELLEEWVLVTEESVNPLYFAGRVLVFLLLTWWGWRLITTPLETNYTGESFLHLINLP
ncbi:MAG: hypothetical protein KF766_18930, partial [Rhodocyclaceae bacterium]|nr:hypothetical protein [Rhodocyclaceae bacterium]